MVRSSVAAQRDGPPLLTLSGIGTGYGKKSVLTNINLTLNRGEAIAIFGHNGAGKTTLLQTIMGLRSPWSGTMIFRGNSIAKHTARTAVNLGMAMIPSERFVYPDLTVRENLLLSAVVLPRTTRDQALELAYAQFPILRERKSQLAGAMSGGEQRMVSLAMALIRKPQVLLLDEPSLGLSPAIVEQVMRTIRGLLADGVSVVLVEQNIPAALSVAARAYVLRSGEIILEESGQQFANRGREGWWQLF